MLSCPAARRLPACSLRAHLRHDPRLSDHAQSHTLPFACSSLRCTLPRRNVPPHMQHLRRAGAACPIPTFLASAVLLAAALTCSVVCSVLAAIPTAFLAAAVAASAATAAQRGSPRLRCCPRARAETAALTAWHARLSWLWPQPSSPSSPASRKNRLSRSEAAPSRHVAPRHRKPRNP